ncbi:MAG: 3-oxoacyl-ACP reductase FabG [Chloroflexota bacterium]|nr:MAG: 3-oxoacyl-ACP reductase FabG [Chloroflexota bacterium]
MLLEDKVALITGGGSGIGRATAVRFAGEGARIVICDVDEEGLDETYRQVAELRTDVVQIVGSVTDRDSVQSMVDAAISQYGRLDILVNNAGITRDGLTVRYKDDEMTLMPDERWDAVLEVNLKGTWLCSQIAGAQMIRQKSGRIVNTASVAALGNIGQANYAASKAGVIGLTKTLALEWARFSIAVNCVAPGAVSTRMTATIPDRIMAGLIQAIPYRRLAEPEEIAAVHAFLASDEASYITGQVIFIDGGLTAGA